MGLKNYKDEKIIKNEKYQMISIYFDRKFKNKFLIKCFTGIKLFYKKCKKEK